MCYPVCGVVHIKEPLLLIFYDVFTSLLGRGVSHEEGYAAESYLTNRDISRRGICCGELSHE